jgi:DNA-binding NarL/FixJ family response regulator
MFEQLDARAWWHAACAELRVTAVTASSRSAPVSDQLTPQQLQVALVVARGATDPEAASRLFVSTKPIEARLGRISHKLGIRPRTKLSVHVGGYAAK